MINLHQNYNIKYQKGAALIVTLLLISVFASLIFVTSKISSSEFKQTTSLEESELAFSAAQSGIETGLLFFRYDKNIEIPNILAGMNPNEILRFNLLNGNSQLISGDTINNDLNNYFDLSIWHRNADNIESLHSTACNDFQKTIVGLCIADNSNTLVIPALKEGDIVEYDIRQINNVDFMGNFFTTNPNQKFEVLLINNLEQKTNIVDLNSNGFVLSTLGFDTMRIKTYNGNLQNLTITSSSAAGVAMDSRYTTIRATGYYGKSKRTIEVKIDRATGSLLSSFDFNLIGSQVKSNIPLPSKTICSNYKTIKISNTTSNEFDNYQIKINIPSSLGVGLLKDVRFLSQNGTNLNYWTNSPDSNNGDIWVKIDKIYANTQTYIYLQYANCNGGLSLSGKDTFELFDHFDDVNYSKTIWDNASSVDAIVIPSSSEAILNKNRVCNADNTDKFLLSQKQFDGSYNEYIKVKSHTDYVRLSIGFRNSFYLYDDGGSSVWGFRLNNVWQQPPQGYNVGKQALNDSEILYESIINKTILSDTSRDFSIVQSVNALDKARIGSWCDSQTVLDWIVITKSSDVPPVATIQ